MESQPDKQLSSSEFGLDKLGAVAEVNSPLLQGSGLMVWLTSLPDSCSKVADSCALLADMPSLVSTDGEDSHEDDVTEADLPPSEYADASDDDDGMPALEPDPYNGASYPLQHAAVVGSGTGLDILQALLPGDVNGELFAEELASVEHPQDSQEESDMPPLIDFADRGGLDAIASGRNTPLDLDQQAALDNLSLTVEDAEDWCTEQVNIMALMFSEGLHDILCHIATLCCITMFACHQVFCRLFAIVHACYICCLGASSTTSATTSCLLSTVHLTLPVVLVAVQLN